MYVCFCSITYARVSSLFLGGLRVVCVKPPIHVCVALLVQVPTPMTMRTPMPMPMPMLMLMPITQTPMFLLPFMCIVLVVVVVIVVVAIVIVIRHAVAGTVLSPSSSPSISVRDLSMEFCSPSDSVCSFLHGLSAVHAQSVRLARD